jgi:hypothetical protein
MTGVRTDDLATSVAIPTENAAVAERISDEHALPTSGVVGLGVSVVRAHR